MNHRDFVADLRARKFIRSDLEAAEWAEAVGAFPMEMVLAGWRRAVRLHEWPKLTHLLGEIAGTADMPDESEAWAMVLGWVGSVAPPTMSERERRVDGDTLWPAPLTAAVRHVGGMHAIRSGEGDWVRQRFVRAYREELARCERKALLGSLGELAGGAVKRLGTGDDPFA